MAMHGQTRQVDAERREVNALVSRPHAGASEQRDAPGRAQDEVAREARGLTAPPALIHAGVDTRPKASDGKAPSHEAGRDADIGAGPEVTLRAEDAAQDERVLGARADPRIDLQDAARFLVFRLDDAGATADVEPRRGLRRCDGWRGQQREHEGQGKAYREPAGGACK